MKQTVKLTNDQQIYLLSMAEQAIFKTGCSKEHRNMLIHGVSTYLRRIDGNAGDKECRDAFLKLNELVHSPTFSGSIEDGYVFLNTAIAVDSGEWVGRIRKKDHITDSAFLVDRAVFSIAGALAVDEDSLNYWVDRFERRLLQKAE